uniref:tRNA-binding domain-containing protein n=1 Tax=Plectus sambesii TaxID=2011161 RepID=A0A914V5T4_9BILA
MLLLRLSVSRLGICTRTLATSASDAAAGKRGKKQKPEPVVDDRPVDVSRLDIRVGRIVSVDKHPNADSLYVEQVDCGDAGGKHRSVVSGLVKHVPIEKVGNRLAVLLCNVKESKMRGQPSQAMVLCASTAEKVEMLDPPANSQPGDRVVCQQFSGSPDMYVSMTKVWEPVSKLLTVSANGQVVYDGHPLEVEGKGPITASTLRNVPIK